MDSVHHLASYIGASAASGDPVPAQGRLMRLVPIIEQLQRTFPGQLARATLGAVHAASQGFTDGYQAKAQSQANGKEALGPLLMQMLVEGALQTPGPAKDGIPAAGREVAGLAEGLETPAGRLMKHLAEMEHTQQESGALAPARVLRRTGWVLLFNQGVTYFHNHDHQGAAPFFKVELCALQHGTHGRSNEVLCMPRRPLCCMHVRLRKSSSATGQ